MKYYINYLEDGKIQSTQSEKELTGFDDVKDSIPNCHIDFIHHDGEGNLTADTEGQDEAQELERLEANKAEALAYQSDQQSQNELGILHGYSVADLETRPVATAQIEWMTSLFALKNARDADPTNDTPLSSVGDKPHSFEQIYAEKWGL